jgi:hypothetical protein
VSQNLTDPTDLGRKKWSPVAQRRMRFREPPIMWLVTIGVVLVVLVMLAVFWLTRPDRTAEEEVFTTPIGQLTVPPAAAGVGTGTAPGTGAPLA